MASLRKMIQGDPIHSRCLDFKTYSLDDDRVIVVGELKDERFLPFHDFAGPVRKEGVVNSCRLWREDGPILREIKEIIEENNRRKGGR